MKDCMSEQDRSEQKSSLCGGPSYGGALPSASRVKTTQRRLLRWYESADRGYQWRRPRASKYQKIVAEVLLQRTKADVVSRMFDGFLVKYPSWAALASASEADLADALRPLGLWRRRAVSLKALSVIIASRRGRYPKSRRALEDLPGVGQYICNAILLFDQGHCQPLLDVNLARVLERVFGPRKLSDIRYDPWLQTLSSSIVRHESPASINWAILDLAAAICTVRKPKCDICPLRSTCCFAQKTKSTV